MDKEEFRSLEKLKKYLEKSFTDFFGSVLDYTEVAVDGKERYKALRSKILNMGNDKIREIKRELDEHYVIKYIPTDVDVIEVINKKM